MSGFEFGEKLTCLKQVKIGREAYAAGEDFPYEEIDVEIDLVESLLNKRFLCRSCRVTPKMLKELKHVNTSKRIRNSPSGRLVVSWPADEPIPEGCIDGRRSAKPAVTSEPQAPSEDIDEDGKVEVVLVSRGWYNVTVDGEVVNGQKLRKQKADKLAKEYEDASI